MKLQKMQLGVAEMKKISGGIITNPGHGATVSVTISVKPGWGGLGQTIETTYEDGTVIREHFPTVGKISNELEELLDESRYPLGYQ